MRYWQLPKINKLYIAMEGKHFLISKCNTLIINLSREKSLLSDQFA